MLDIVKEGVNLSLFANETILYIEGTDYSIKRQLELKIQFRKLRYIESTYKNQKQFYTMYCDI